MLSRAHVVDEACADFPREVFWLPRKWLAPRFNITRWTTMPRGGHFATFEQPELLVEVVRVFFWGPAIATGESKVNLTGR